MVKKRNASLISIEEKELFSNYALERRSLGFGIEKLREQKRHAEMMLEILRPKLYEAYMAGKNGLSDQEMVRKMKINLKLIMKRRNLAAQWLMQALGKFKK